MSETVAVSNHRFSLSLYPALIPSPTADCMGLWLKLGWWENGNVVIKTRPI